MIKMIYESERTGRVAEVELFQQPSWETPTEWDEVWVVTTYKPDEPENFVERDFLNEMAAKLFLEHNGYKELVS